jgi:hypothetical protein
MVVGGPPFGHSVGEEIERPLRRSGNGDLATDIGDRGHD